MSAEQPKKKSRKNILILGGLVIVGICICGSILATFFPSEESPTPVTMAGNGQEMEQANTAEPTDVPDPTNTAQPTNTPTPRPTNTPTSTPDPNIVERGTHLVGIDIQTGLYHGFTTGSCYWERLRGLSGTFDDIIANDNASGQFYVSITENDVAFSVGCAVRLLDPMPEPPDEFPEGILTGTYLIGFDIRPGLYTGNVGTGSCYWERLSGLSGEFADIIANDNVSGQFYVSISDGDAAFSISCSATLLDPLPEPPDEFPDEIEPGTYLVGIDIQPGLYRGSADVSSCYWERLRDVSGDFNGIIANDNANGQFFIQVAPSDFALHTKCKVERTGD
jgi:hypothetical protein